MSVMHLSDKSKAVIILAVLLLGAAVLMISADAAEPTDPATALMRLKMGAARFAMGESTFPNLDAARRAETAEQGQRPFAVVLACSDSRVPVELLFDQGVGDLFVIRIAGNVCDTDEAGSIEYGVDHLETPLLVVLGHSRCGAVTAVATDAELHGSIPALVDNIRPAVARVRHAHPGLAQEALVAAAVRENVRQSIRDLLDASPAARKRVAAGTLRVEGAVYDIASGEVEWMGPHPEQAAILKNPPAAETHAPEGGRKAATHALEEAQAAHQAPAHDTPAAEAAPGHEAAAHGQEEGGAAFHGAPETHDPHATAPAAVHETAHAPRPEEIPAGARPASFRHPDEEPESAAAHAEEKPAH